MPPKQINAKAIKEKEEDEAYTSKSATTKKEKDPNAIKRPLSSYFLFMNNRRITLKQEKPNVGMGEQTKIMTAEWKNLSSLERQKWDNLASEDKQRYEDEKEAAGIKSTKKTTNTGDKKPMSGYMVFGKEFRAKLLKSNPDTRQADVMKMIGEAW